MIEYLKKSRKRFNSLKNHKIQLKNLNLMWDNARPQAAAETRHFLTQHDMEQVKQSPHSPDLNLCDRFLFRKLKHLLRDELFRTHEEATSAIQRAMKMIEENELFGQLKKLREHCKDVITAGGDYIY